MQKTKKRDKVETDKRAKRSFELAGIYYADVNKVKSKSRAILNMRKDGEDLDAKEEAFMQDIIKNHDKMAAKMKDFVKFTVGVHPDHEQTRCFFVVKKDGSKEDFSVSKCI